MLMPRWICGNARRDWIRNDDMHERLEVAPVEEKKLVQHRLRWFRHIQWRPAETPFHNGVIGWTGNEKRGRWRPNLIRQESVKRDLNNWCISKELALDMREWKLAIYVPELWSLITSLLLPFCHSFFTPFHFLA
jgi:hypothetical protein